jgi:hypothetical protein
MMGTDSKTNLHADFKPPSGSEKDNVGRLHGIVVWEQNASVKQPSFKISPSRASNGKVPLKEIVLSKTALDRD